MKFVHVASSPMQLELANFERLLRFMLLFMALIPSTTLRSQSPWPADPSRLDLQARESLFGSRWSRIPTDEEINEARTRLTQSVLREDNNSIETRPDGTVVVSKRKLLDTQVVKKHALFLKPEEVGLGVNQVLLYADYESAEEIMTSGKLMSAKTEKYRSVFRLIAQGKDRDVLEFQFELSLLDFEENTTVDEVFADHWYDFSKVALTSLSRPIVPTVETIGAGPDRVPPRESSTTAMPKLPTAVVVDQWWDGTPRYVGWHLISAGQPEARELGVESPAGAVVASVNPNSPAEAAGMTQGDLVVAFEGRELDTPEDLEALLLQSTVGSRRTVRISSHTKFVTYDTELMIEADRRDREPFGEYAHPYVGWRLQLPRDWRLDPYARRDEASGKVYDLIKSPYGNYEFRLYQDTRPVEDLEKVLGEFVAEAINRFGDHHVGRLTLGTVPSVFVASPVGETERRILIRIAMVVDKQLCEVDISAHPLADFENLPPTVTCVLGTINNRSKNP